MKIEKIKVEGFRLLEDIEIMLEPTSTVIVGRNNSGKTSLTDVFDRFSSDTAPRFRLEDFSASTRKRFINARNLRKIEAAPEAVLAALPKIVVTLTFRYNKNASDLGPLSAFVIDLDPTCTTAIARIQYASTLASLDALLDISLPKDDVDPIFHFFKCLRDNLPRNYSTQVAAIDPTDEFNHRYFEGTNAFNSLLQCSLVRAQRTLDHAKHGDPDVIGKLLSTLFKTATAPTAAAADQALASQLKTSVETIERGVQENFDEMLKGLLPALEVFGFPSFNDTELRPETSLNVEALLADHTKIVYTGTDGVHLPEGYNGLGTRNLIYMLLQLESYHKIYRSKAPRPGTHLIFLEEPEAHLHPQMQEVLINQLDAAVGKLSAKYPEEPAWQVQFVITTHSSHVANAAAFDAVRYFLANPSEPHKPRQTKVKDFKKGTALIREDDRDFLHQYMTLTKCDLYFADKAILVEGATERILMPRLCEISDKDFLDENKLARQYVTTVEVGGAYAHLFYPLLDFLELKTLVITDLDSVRSVIKKDKNGKEITTFEKCPVAYGELTSNVAVREWFRPLEEKKTEGWQKKTAPSLTISSLCATPDDKKVDSYRRIAYQIPEKLNSEVCARSYEDALVLANPDRFTWPKNSDEATEAWEIAKDLPKAATALRFAIQEKDWVVPRYIREGLKWLSEPPPQPGATPTAAVAKLAISPSQVGAAE